MKKNAVLVGTTFYKREDELRYRLAIQTVMKAKEAGYTVVVIDGSPNGFVRARFEEIGADVYLQTVRGMGPSRRQAFFLADEKMKDLEIDIGFWLELEKTHMVDFVDQTIEPIVNGEADIVLPFRTEKSWETYPAMQRESEFKMNATYNTVMRQIISKPLPQLDPAVGPIAWHRKFSKYFIGCDGRNMTPRVKDTYIGQYAPMFAAALGGARMGSVPVDFEYPPEQKAEEEGPLAEEMVVKRRRQLDEITEGYHAVRMMCSQG